MKLGLNVIATLLLTLSFCALAHAQATDIAVVVNPSNATSNLSMPELRKILAGEKRTWPGGQPVKLFVRGPGSQERAVFLKVLRYSENDYKTHWTTQMFRGEAQSEPLSLPSNGMQMEAVRTFPGAIVLIVNRDIKSGMKIVKVDGHLPGEPQYPLR